MRYSIDDFIKELHEIIPEVELELEKRKNGFSGEGTINQLELFLRELNSIKQMALTNSFPPKGHRYTEFSWYIRDSWDSKNPSLIHTQLLKFADKYKRKLP